MARQGIEVDFDGIYDLEKQLKALGEDVLKEAVVNALTKTKDFVNDEIQKAMDASQYNFSGEGYSKLKTQKGLDKVEQMEVEINGTTAVAYAGVSFNEAPELWFIAHGAPTTPKDPKIYNAVRVKGKVAQKVAEIQREEFNKVLEAALNG
jgi:hypothetical protein